MEQVSQSQMCVRVKKRSNCAHEKIQRGMCGCGCERERERDRERERVIKFIK